MGNWIVKDRPWLKDSEEGIICPTCQQYGDPKTFSALDAKAINLTVLSSMSGPKTWKIGIDWKGRK